MKKLDSNWERLCENFRFKHKRWRKLRQKSSHAAGERQKNYDRKIQQKSLKINQWKIKNSNSDRTIVDLIDAKSTLILKIEVNDSTRSRLSVSVSVAVYIPVRLEKGSREGIQNLRMWAASCLASCCASCTCGLCTSAASGITRRSARIAYCGLFGFFLVLSWILREVAAPLLEKIPCTLLLLHIRYFHCERE